MLAGPKSLLRGFQLTNHVRFRVQHPHNRVGGAAGDHPGPGKHHFRAKNTIFLHFFEEKMQFFGADKPEKLVTRLLIDETHVFLSPAPSK